MANSSTPAEPAVQAGVSEDTSQTTAPEAADQNQPSQPEPTNENQPAPAGEPEGGEGGEPAAPANDDDLAGWAEKQGIDLENPSPEQAKTIAKRLRDTQKAYTESRQALKAAQEFSKETQPDVQQRLEEIEDPVERQLAYLTVKQQNTDSALMAERFFGANPEYIPYRQEMAKIVADDIARYGDRMNDYWQDNLEKLGELAKGASVEAARAEAYTQGRQEERQSVARQQSIATPQSHATTPASPGRQPITSPEQIRAMPEGERRERQAEIFQFFKSMQSA